jgi:drug/metabolite transporter (DMT)-like permease
MEKSHHHGFYFGALAALASAAVAVLTKFVPEVPNQALVFFRFLISLALLLCFAKRRIVFIRSSVRKHLIRDLAGLISIYCYFYAVKGLPLVNATTLTNTTPLFLPFVVLLWSRMIVSKVRFGAAILGFIGVVVMLRPTAENFYDFASFAGLGTGLLSAIAFIGIRNLSRTDSPETILFYYFAVSTAVSFFPMIWDWEPISGWIPWSCIAGIGIFSALYQYFTTRSFSLAPASKVAGTVYLSVIFSGIAGWLIFHEAPDLWVFVGAALSIVGGVIALLDPTPSRPIK